jgi:dipeptidase
MQVLLQQERRAQMNVKAGLLALCFAAIPLLFHSAFSCTNFLVTKGASTDGSTMITYTCDGEFHPHLEYLPPEDHEPGDMEDIEDWYGNVLGQVAHVPHTYGVVQLMNEHQLVIGETTFTGREDLRNPDGLLHYWTLMRLALQRAKTARQAITIMGELVEEYGYSSTGESFSIADPNEVWILEMIGPGPGGKGAHWVALRVPDGYVCAHANMARIGEFPLDDPDNCLYSEDVISFAIARGYYDPSSGEPFRYNTAYCPPTPEGLIYTETRVWSMFRRCAPSQNFSPDYHRGVEGAERYPLWIKPDKKISLQDVFDVMRDHYEGTEFDMTVGVDAGPFGCPYRWRPLGWEVDSVKYAWERPISTQQTGFSYVSQSRSWLPDAIGGILWYGVDDTYFTCYLPLYCGITDLPESFMVGSLQQFSWDSAWWVFNIVSNYACLKYSHMIKDIQEVQGKLEGDLILLQPEIESTALDLADSNRELMTTFLTNYSVSNGERIVNRWRELAEHLFTKYNDGYVKNEKGRPEGVGYPERWLRAVIRAKPENFKVKTWEPKEGPEQLPF